MRLPACYSTNSRGKHRWGRLFEFPTELLEDWDCNLRPESARASYCFGAAGTGAMEGGAAPVSASSLTRASIEAGSAGDSS